MGCQGAEFMVASGVMRALTDGRPGPPELPLTHLRHWLCTAALVLMRGLSPIKVLV